MYELFFGLRERPFDLLPNPRFLYLAGRHREAYSNLRYALGAAKGLTLLIGDAGTGKTTLVQSALADVDRDSVECVVVSNPTLTRNEFYEFLTAGFNLSADAALSKTRFLVEFREHLQARHDAGLLSALIVDEAQSLPYELLEEVRLLSNIETSTVKLLNVVLAGQPELATRLNESQLRQLKQRISLRCELKPLDLAETAAYVAGRLRIAGGKPAEIFTREAIVAVNETAHGIPRTVNVICDNALIGGFASQVRPVGRAIVEEICRDFDLRPASEPPGEEPRQETEAEPLAVPAEPALVPPLRPERTEALFGAVARKKRFSFF
jgi:general secretion pathway protein A